MRCGRSLRRPSCGCMKASCAGYARLHSGLAGTGATLPAALTAAAALPPATLGCGSGARYEARTRTGALAHVADGLAGRVDQLRERGLPEEGPNALVEDTRKAVVSAS